MSFKRKLSKKFWFLLVKCPLKASYRRTLIFTSQMSFKRNFDFYHSNVLWKKVIEEILIFTCQMSFKRKLLKKFWFLHVKCPLKESYLRYFDLYVSNVLWKKVIEEILIFTCQMFFERSLSKKLWFLQSYRRNFDFYESNVLWKKVIEERVWSSWIQLGGSWQISAFSNEIDSWNFQQMLLF